jgi:sugar/nucleoside kinase (ribokinase family)
MDKIVTMGEILVEIVTDQPGDGFRQPLHLVGPFPSGAPAIFIDQVARLGHPCGIIAAVGDDDFGRLNLQRLADDGVDVDAVQVIAGQATGSAFVRYRANGERDFVYNIKHSAAGQVRLTSAGLRLLDECAHFHVSGASLFARDVSEMTNQAVRVVKGNGGSVSFDPNIRKEVVGDPEVRQALVAILGCCDFFLPSGEELTLLTEASAPEDAVRELIASGVKAVVVKEGARGATYHDAGGSVSVPGYRAQEVDPTGAGDCFGATFITCRLRGLSVEDSLAYANASGAMAVSVKGPMEGAASLSQLDALRSGSGVPLRERRGLPAGRRRIGVLGTPVGRGSGDAASRRRRDGGADRGHLQPGKPPRRLHRSHPSGLP